MKFLLDENFPKKAAELLRNHSYECLDIRGTDNEGVSDEEIFQIAQDHQAVFLTTDKDFYHSIHLLFKPHSGIVVIALKQPNSLLILNKLEWFLTHYEDNTLSNQCFLITDHKCFISRN